MHKREDLQNTLHKLVYLRGDIMKVLVACEESQRVCMAFREKGHEAYSADIQECSGGHPEWHILGDVLPIINGDCKFQTMDGEQHEIKGEWDLLIAHPPCTYLSNAGARWLYAGRKLNEERYKMGLEAKKFFMSFYNAKCKKIAVENPIPSKVYNMPKYTQTVQPYEHGHPYSKKTCLWLKGLPELKPSNMIAEYKPYCSSGSYSKTHEEKYKGVSRKGGSAKIRSKTFEGIAKAMADQWGDISENEKLLQEPEFVPKSRTEINRESNKRRLKQFNYMLSRSLVFAFRDKVEKDGRTQREVVIELLEKYIE